MRAQRAQPQNTLSALTAVTGVAGILFGIIVGYIIGTGRPQYGASASATSAPAAAALPTPVLVTEAELQGHRDILASDPTNARAAEALGNKLYDAQRYVESIPYYQQALANDPKNVNVSTDLGTALHYAGRSDEALAQFQKSLSVDAIHAQTLFNIGIVKRDGLKDTKGAIEAWERLLAVTPGYPEAARVRALIAEAQ